MCVWGYVIDEGVKAWVLFMIMMKFAVEFHDEIAKDYDEMNIL